MKKKLFIQIGIAAALLGGVYLYSHHEQTQPSGFHIITLDIGQGDAHLIKFRDGEKMLVDCGPDKKVLERLGANLNSTDRTIDYLLITHPHLDHYGGCIDVLKRYTIKHIVYNTVGSDKDSYWRTWDASMHQSGAELIQLKHADTWTIASASLEFLNPDPEVHLLSEIDNPNNASIVFRLVDQPTGKRVLFTGDAEEPLEKALLTRYCSASSTPDNLSSSSSSSSSTISIPTSTKKKNSPSYLAPCPALQAEVLKAGHHGSDTSSSENFLKAVQPKIVVVSCGLNNKFHHPSLPTVKRLQRMNIEILRTDQKGDILIQ